MQKSWNSGMLGRVKSAFQSFLASLLRMHCHLARAFWILCSNNTTHRCAHLITESLFDNDVSLQMGEWLQLCCVLANYGLISNEWYLSSSCGQLLTPLKLASVSSYNCWSLVLFYRPQKCKFHKDLPLIGSFEERNSRHSHTVHTTLTRIL